LVVPFRVGVLWSYRRDKEVVDDILCVFRALHRQNLHCSHR
jgi:hypothetical protein